MRLWGWMPEHSFLGRSVVHVRPDGWLLTACLSVGRSNLSSCFRTKIYSHFSALLWMFWRSYRSCCIKVLHFPQLRSDDGRSSSCHWSLRLFGSPFEAIESIIIKCLSYKTALLLALTFMPYLCSPLVPSSLRMVPRVLYTQMWHICFRLSLQHLSCLQQHLVSLLRSWTWWRGYQTGRWLWWHMHIYAGGFHHRRSSDLKAWIGVSSVRSREGMIFHTICVVPPLGNRSYTHHIFFPSCQAVWYLLQASATTDNLAMICVSIYPNWMCATPSALF